MRAHEKLGSAVWLGDGNQEARCFPTVFVSKKADLCDCRHWAGQDFYLPGPAGNDISRTNVPTSRIKHRHDTLVQELRAILMTDLRDPNEAVSEDEALSNGPTTVTRKPSASGLKSTTIPYSFIRTVADPLSSAELHMTADHDTGWAPHFASFACSLADAHTHSRCSSYCAQSFLPKV